MALFEYEQLGIDSASTGATAVIDAPDRAAAVRLLQQRGITPRRLEEVDERRAGKRRSAVRPVEVSAASAAAGPPQSVAARSRAPGSAASRADLALLIRDLAVATSAGLTLVQAMRVVQRQSRKPRVVALLAHLIHEVEEGRSLSEAAASWGKPFNDLLVGLFRAGEQSGRLGQILDQAATLLERDQKMRRSLVSGMIYPAILAVLIAAAVTLVVTFVVPKLLAPLAGRMSAAQLPWPTRVVLGATDVLTSYWYWFLLALAAIILLGRQLLTNPETRLPIDRAILRLPVFGRLAKDIAVARFSRTMGTLAGAGLPILTALRGSSATLGNLAMRGAVEEVAQEVQAGKTIAEPLERTGLFPPMLTQIIGVGERSGKLPEMLDRAAVVFEERTENSLKVVTTVVPPVLVVGAALVIGFVVLAVFLALLEVQNAIG